MVNKLITKVKNIVIKTKSNETTDEEYKFSTEEIENLQEQNKQKIENLKKGSFKQKKVTFTSVSKKLSGILDEPTSKEESSDTENVTIEETKIDNDLTENIEDKKLDNEKKSNNITDEEISIDEQNNENEQDKTENDSYVNLSPKNQEIIMKSWEAIDLQQIDRDIIEGKDLLNHNYNITYGDNAAKFVHEIRKKYEIVICYLIGFNNEKKGIPNKTILSNKVDDEWKYLSNYIKLLEKIRSFRK